MKGLSALLNWTSAAEPQALLNTRSLAALSPRAESSKTDSRSVIVRLSCGAPWERATGTTPGDQGTANLAELPGHLVPFLLFSHPHRHLLGVIRSSIDSQSLSGGSFQQ